MSDAFCAVMSGHLIYAGTATREEFDLIFLPEKIHDWQPDSTTTFLKNDGQQWESRCHSKMLGNFSASDMTVVFQWFDRRVAEAS